MPRIRTVKPDFFLDDELAKLPYITRLIFVGLWCCADKAGRLDDNPAKLKVMILPYENDPAVSMDAELDRLADKPFITRYGYDGRKYIQIINWERHQRPHHTEKDSEIPEGNDTITVKEPLRNGETPVGREGKGRERKGKEYAPSVTLTPLEYDTLRAKYGEVSTHWMLEKLSAYKASTGRKYKSDAGAIRSWVVSEAQKVLGSAFGQKSKAEVDAKLKAEMAVAREVKQ